MNIIEGAARVITRSADATVAAAGALGGAAINGVIGGVQGAATGIKTGVSSGSHSTPAAALALAGIGAAGLVDWPILVGIGGTALVVRQLSKWSDGEEKPILAAVPDPSDTTRRRAPAKRAPARKTTRSTTSSTRKSSAKTRRAAAKR